MESKLPVYGDSQVITTTHSLVITDAPATAELRIPAPTGKRADVRMISMWVQTAATAADGTFQVGTVADADYFMSPVTILASGAFAVNETLTSLDAGGTLYTAVNTSASRSVAANAGLGAVGADVVIAYDDGTDTTLDAVISVTIDWV